MFELDRKKHQKYRTSAPSAIYSDLNVCYASWCVPVSVCDLTVGLSIRFNWLWVTQSLRLGRNDQMSKMNKRLGPCSFHPPCPSRLFKKLVLKREQWCTQASWLHSEAHYRDWLRILQKYALAQYPSSSSSIIKKQNKKQKKTCEAKWSCTISLWVAWWEI